jgi:hypothetical protein
MYRELAFKQNFERILKIAWLRILAEIQLYLKKDTSSQVSSLKYDAFFSVQSKLTYLINLREQ